MHMEITNENVSKELISIKRDLALIKHLLEEDFELSTSAKKALEKARQTPEEEYIILE